MAEQDDIEEPTEEELEELEEDNLENKEEESLEDIDIRNDYGYPTPEEKQNAHAIIGKAIEKPDTTRVTFLTESELGRPLFSVRFLSDLHDDALRLGLDRIADYYYEKLQNITSTGMSNRGFTMNLNVTQKRDSTRRRDNLKNQKETKNERR